MNLRHRMEEGLLAVIVLLNILEFFEIIPGDQKTIKLCISWVILAYLIYRVDLGKIFFGTTNHWLTAGILTGNFFLLGKNIFAFAAAAHASANIFRGLLTNLLYLNTIFPLEYYLFIGGAAIFLIIAIISSLTIPVKKKSLLGVLHQIGRSEHKLFRILLLFILFLAFYITVFNFFFEWLGTILDSPLALLTIFIYIFIVIRHHKRFSIDSLIFKAGNAGESFYEKYMEFFREKENLALGISGILVLHLMTDLGSFLVPFVIGVGGFELATNTFISLFITQTTGAGPIIYLSSMIVYILNIIALLFFFVSPSFIWYQIYKKKGLLLKKHIIILFICSGITALISPIFRIESIHMRGLAGVQIILQHANNVVLALVASLAFGVIIHFTHKKRIWIMVCLASICAFFSYYIFLYSKSVMGSYIGSISYLSKDWAFHSPTILVLAIFLIITILFYAGGFLIFLTEASKEYRRIR